jgi:hypothetical protein
MAMLNVVKSEPKEVITDETVIGGQGPYTRGLLGKDSLVYLQDLYPHFKNKVLMYDALLLESEATKAELKELKQKNWDYSMLLKSERVEAEANAKKAKAWDELEKWLLNEKEIDFDERDFIGPVSVLDKMSELEAKP